jgi:NADH-quinone oxidoreductase subunit J
MELSALIFYMLAALAVVSGLGVVLHKSALYSALSLVVAMISLALLFVQLNAGFLGAIQVLVYAGAIMVLFVFIIMLLNLAGASGRQFRNVPGKALGVIGLTFVVAAIAAAMNGIGSGEPWPIAPDGFGSIASVGELLFREYVLPFELAGVLLLSAILGTIVLARRRD